MDARSSCGRGAQKAKKVKSGCRTCKIRKVKCDEIRPICSRCTSTGRVCDGYGIWGGGETLLSQQQRLASEREARTVSRPPVVVLLPGSSFEERDGFEWFKCRTAPKLPGSFRSNFWSTLLFQASFDDPAVLQAILALSYIHRGGHVGSEPRTFDHEGAALQHYVKAIKSLHPHFTNGSKTSSRIALIACIVFINLEFLRGHFQTAQTHLGNGIRILQDMQWILEGSDGIFRDAPGLGTTDTWIVESFARMQFQLEMFRYGHDHQCLLLEVAEWSTLEGTPAKFTSLQQAWGAMTRQLNKIFHLASLARQQVHQQQLYQSSEELLQIQRSVQTGLAWWIDTYKSSEEIPQGLMFGDMGRRAWHLLLMTYHTLANIIVDTALKPNDELVYDSYTAKFSHLLQQLTDLHDVSVVDIGVKKLPDHVMDMDTSITDMGWTPLLYYVATKCRVRAIRSEAVKLLESRSHREGMWDSRSMACVAKKVLDMEEADYYQDINKLGHNMQAEPVEFGCEELLPLPGSYRLREVEVTLWGAPMDTIMLFGKRQQDGFRNRVLLSTYHVPSQCWKDA